MSKFIEANEKIAEKVVEGYKKIENGAVDGFNRMNDKIIERVFAKDGESLEEAKDRLSKNTKKDKE